MGWCQAKESKGRPDLSDQHEGFAQMMRHIRLACSILTAHELQVER